MKSDNAINDAGCGLISLKYLFPGLASCPSIQHKCLRFLRFAKRLPISAQSPSQKLKRPTSYDDCLFSFWSFRQIQHPIKHPEKPALVLTAKCDHIDAVPLIFGSKKGVLKCQHDDVQKYAE